MEHLVIALPFENVLDNPALPFLRGRLDMALAWMHQTAVIVRHDERQ